MLLLLQSMMMNCGVTFLLLLMAGVCHGQDTSNNDMKFCGGNPADLVFVMDSSGSIDPGAFVKQKEFVKAMVDLFDIDSGKIRLGVVSYSNWAFLEFHMNSYSTKADMKRAISNVTHFKGDTNTGSTIAYMRDVMFQPENGARPDVPHIAMVLTDGRSNDPLYTMKESELARNNGLTLFAIGVGEDVSKYELSSIASDPDENYVFKVGDYDALIQIKEILAMKACGVPPPSHVTSWTLPTTRKPTTPQPIIVIEEACKGVEYADIVFAMAPASSPQNSNKTLTFFKDIVDGLDLSHGKLRVGMVPKECSPMDKLENTAGMSQKKILDELDKSLNSLGNQTHTANVIRFMRKHSFTTDKGARRNSKKMGVLIVDNNDILTKSKVEALKAKNFGDIELFVIAVGPDVNIGRLAKVASQSTEDHLFHVDSYDELRQLIPRVQNSICPPSDHSNTLL